MERSRSRVDAGSNAPGGGGVSGNYSDSYDYLFKFLVIGSAGTGKSCLLHHFIEGRFKEDSSHTIGVEFGSKIVPVGGKTVKLQVYQGFFIYIYTIKGLPRRIQKRRPF